MTALPNVVGRVYKSAANLLSFVELLGCSGRIPMIRRILLLAIFAGMPVAELRAEFLFSSIELSASSVAGASGPQHGQDPLRAPEVPEPVTILASQSAGMDSSGPSTLTSVVSAGALPATRVCVVRDDIVSSRTRERTRLYQQPSHAGPFKPPRAAC